MKTNDVCYSYYLSYVSIIIRRLDPIVTILMEFKVKPHTYSIILPTYNEKDNLPIIVWLIMKYMTPTKHDFEIVIVDDNSPDGTYQVAKDLQAIYGERIVVKKREKKLGLGKQKNNISDFSFLSLITTNIILRLCLYLWNEICQRKFRNHYGRRFITPCKLNII